MKRRHDLATEHLAQVDRKLARLIDAAGPFRPERQAGEPYQALVRSIVYQQLSGKAAATILGRVVALVPSTTSPAAAVPRGGRVRIPSPGELLALSDEALRGAGLSRMKISYLRALCEAAVSGVVPDAKAARKMADEEIIEALTSIKGIGRWSVEMLLIFNLGRLDVLPATDYGVRKGYGKIYGKGVLPTPGELLRFGERWRPYRTVGAWYMWRALEVAASP